MEHLKASPCGDAHESLSPQTEQFISLLERRGIVEDPEITSERVREAERELRRNMYHNTQRTPTRPGRRCGPCPSWATCTAT